VLVEEVPSPQIAVCADVVYRLYCIRFVPLAISRVANVPPPVPTFSRTVYGEPHVQ